jgi:DNA polymerase-3 subunit alpha
MKVHYPTEFQTAALTLKSGNTAKISTIINDCNRMGIKVLPPKINESEFSFKANPEKKEILFGFGAVKGIGESVISKIIENQPYKSFDDYLEKIQDKTATIALIKANAFPTSNRMKLMQRYAKSLYEVKEYKPVATYPTKLRLLTDWDIDVDQFKEGRKVNKEAVLELYNKKKKSVFDIEQQQKYKKHMEDFREKYATDEFLWEFQSLSMFITHNPLQEAYDLIGTEWDDVEDGDKAVVPCVIVDIKRKKDKNNNPFAYIDLCTNNGIVEGTIWSRQLKQYSDLIAKGSCISILGRKKEGHLFVEAVKPYQVWLDKIKRIKAKANIYNY